MLDTEEIQRVRYEIDTLGFSVVEGVIDAAQCRRLREDLLDTLEVDNKNWGGLPNKTFDLVNNLAIYGGSFLDLLDNEVMRQVFDEFLSESCILYNYSSTILLPGGTPGAANIHVDTPRLVPGHHLGLIMTLALDDFTADNGATHYLPGSQNLLQPPAAEVFKKYAASVARPAGAAVFFNPRCFHRATANNTQLTRCGVTVYATRVYMKPRFDFPRMLQPALLEGVSPRVRQFLGFDARVPAGMAEFYVEESQRLYKGGQG
jgi:ectoine hydroxylase-related dioxygenase (phytanoyl-CoA dioxygenase family)